MSRVILNLKFLYDESRVDLFFRGEQDILFARETELKRFSHIRMAPLFQSRFYIVMCGDDSLADRENVNINDLAGRTLMVGGGYSCG